LFRTLRAHLFIKFAMSQAQRVQLIIYFKLKKSL
jgi:hypothetical protein